jgi:hypothetical protein
MILGATGCAFVSLTVHVGYWHERVSPILFGNPNLVQEEERPQTTQTAQPQPPPPQVTLPQTEQNVPQKRRRRRRRKQKQEQQEQEQQPKTEDIKDPRRQEVVAACLLIKDDNEILGEWIAYHYFALNVRHLIVAVDPQSVTSPLSILQRWNPHLQGNHTQNDNNNNNTSPMTTMDIQTWSDPDFMPQSFLEAANPANWSAPSSQETEEKEDNDDSQRKRQIENHRLRQVTFLSTCLNHFRSKNHTWVIHIDTDEYVIANPLLRSNQSSSNNNNNHTVWSIPSPSEPSSVYHILEQIRRNRQLHIRTKFPCISMPRLVFGSVEDEPNTNFSTLSSDISISQTLHLPKTILDIDHHFDTHRFETLRWRYHTHYNDTERNAQPKCIVDVSRVTNPRDRMFHNPFSIHRPSAILCRGIRHVQMYETDAFPLIVHHYTGSRERYFRRSDARRNEERFQAKANVRDGYDDFITAWLDGFIRFVGIDTARTVLPEYMRVATPSKVVDG